MSNNTRVSVVYTIAILNALAVGWLLMWFVSALCGFEITISFKAYNEHWIEGLLFSMVVALGIRAMVIVNNELGDGDG